MYVTNRSSGWKQETVYWCSNTNKQFFGMKCIELTQGKRAIVDDEDYDELSKWKWKLLKTKTKEYAIQNISERNDNRRTLMHRMILNPKQGYVVDHIDGNGLNNTRANIRICTQSQNMQNCGYHKNNSSGFKGVQLDKRRGKYIARIRLTKYKRVSTKYFETAEDAHNAYILLAKKWHKEYAKYTCG